MNADSDTRFPHLDLGDLVAEANGQPIGGQAREHLASCEHCQLEADRWNLVADGVRGLAAAAPEIAQPARPQPARPQQPARPRRTGRRVLAGPARRAMVLVGSAAAALVLLVGVGAVTGLVHVHLNGHGTEAALTAVTGCTRLEQADGTLERVSGSSVVIKTASGRLVTVTTTATTRVSASGTLVGDIKDGATVLLAGTSSAGTVAADLVVVGGNPSLHIPGFVTVRGTVSDTSATGFTVVTSAGTQVPVTTSRSTDVVVSNASLGQLRAGGRTIAVGHAGQDGTLSALGVVQPPSWPAGAHITVRMRDCSPASINHELMALAGG